MTATAGNRLETVHGSNGGQKPDHRLSSDIGRFGVAAVTKSFDSWLSDL